MAGRAASLPVLTYHSISQAPGPTCIPPATFATQMEVLAGLGFRALTLDRYLAWRAGEEGGERAVLITFDDGFADFHDTAWPILASHGFTALMFLPTAHVGGSDAWSPAPRPLMGWDQVAELAAAGAEFGAHGITHSDLTTLSPQARRDEIVRSGEEIAARLGRPTRAFAAPYGRVNPEVLAEAGAAYDAAFGVRLARSRRSDPAADLPRIEMHYFRDPARWRGFLQGRELYFQARRALRTARGLVAGG